MAITDRNAKQKPAGRVVDAESSILEVTWQEQKRWMTSAAMDQCHQVGP